MLNFTLLILSSHNAKRPHEECRFLGYGHTILFINKNNYKYVDLEIIIDMN